MHPAQPNRISLAELKELFPSKDIISIDNDFFMTCQSYKTQFKIFKYPCRIDGFIAAYCMEGDLKVTINLTEYRIGAGMLILCTPGNIFKVEPVTGPDAMDSCNFILIGTSANFIANLNMDINKLFVDALNVIKKPCLTLTDKEKSVAQQYLELIGTIITSDLTYKKDSVASLASSIFYTFGGFFEQRTHNEYKENKSMVGSARNRMMFEQFIKLVTEYHNEERMVGFYAAKLCVTPKYLSKIIKTISGMSAPQWINDFVVLEAKNLLKYSALTIKEISYRLNFPNQSFFYKFFKAHTGMTPNQYRQQ